MVRFYECRQADSLCPIPADPSIGSCPAKSRSTGNNRHRRSVTHIPDTSQKQNPCATTESIPSYWPVRHIPVVRQRNWFSVKMEIAAAPLSAYVRAIDSGSNRSTRSPLNGVRRLISAIILDPSPEPFSASRMGITSLWSPTLFFNLGQWNLALCGFQFNLFGGKNFIENVSHIVQPMND